MIEIKKFFGVASCFLVTFSMKAPVEDNQAPKIWSLNHHMVEAWKKYNKDLQSGIVGKTTGIHFSDSMLKQLNFLESQSNSANVPLAFNPQSGLEPVQENMFLYEAKDLKIFGKNKGIPHFIPVMRIKYGDWCKINKYQNPNASDEGLDPLGDFLAGCLGAVVSGIISFAVFTMEYDIEKGLSAGIGGILTGFICCSKLSEWHRIPERPNVEFELDKTTGWFWWKKPVVEAEGFVDVRCVGLSRYLATKAHESRQPAFVQENDAQNGSLMKFKVLK